MKRKIITLFLSSFLIFSNILTSFASPLVVAPVTISYKSLMALMGIGVSFGLALPKNDEEYWDYTRSLRDHLHLVDEDYLDKLDKIVGEWETNNNNKPDNQKEPLKIPFIPNLDKLFNNVGKDVSKSYSYVGDLINSVPIRKGEYLPTFNSSINLYPLTSNSVVAFYTPNGDVLFRYDKGSGTWGDLKVSYDNKKWQVIGNINNNNVVDGIIYVSPCYDYWKTSDGQPILSFIYNYKLLNENINQIRYPSDLEEKYLPSNSLINSKPFINYSPSSPSVDNDELVLPSLPNISIPSKETIPGYQENITKEPFDVQFPNTDTPPGTDTDTPPGTDTDTSFPSFPSFGDSLDFSPMYLTNVADKFPFSLPWDLKRLIEKFDVDPVPPVFDVPILSETITLDLTEFSELASIVRFFILICFVLSLIFISTKLKG